MSSRRELVSLSVSGSGVATLELKDRVGKNEMSEALMSELLGRLMELPKSKEIKVLVIAGLEDVFCGGASREVVMRGLSGERAPFEIEAPQVMLDVPVPVVAAMEGSAWEGGLCLGACSDLVVMAKESRYGVAAMSMGLTPELGLTSLLEHLVSAPVAHEMLLAGVVFKGVQLEGRGHVSHVLPRASVREKAFELAERLAEKPRTALELLKRALVVPRKRGSPRFVVGEGP